MPRRVVAMSRDSLVLVLMLMREAWTKLTSSEMRTAVRQGSFVERCVVAFSKDSLVTDEGITGSERICNN
jgi:hypothetical protein